MEKSSGGKAKKVQHFFKNAFLLVLLLAVTTVSTLMFYERVAAPSGPAQVAAHLAFDATVAESEKSRIQDGITALDIELKGQVNAKVITDADAKSGSPIIDVYVPVTNWNASRQTITKTELKSTAPLIWHEADQPVRVSIATSLDIASDSMSELSELSALDEQQIALIPIGKLDSSVKLLSLDDDYYLDSFQSGGIFRMLQLEGGNADELSAVTFSDIPTKDTTLSYMQTGVTALTRVMMRKLSEVGGNPLYFSEKIGDFLSSADITHVSNEVSFKDNCQFSMTSFCSDPRFIETLKDSGVDVVELTGNHNNDQGRDLNTNTINLYRSLGWQTVGGGLNADDASTYYIADTKGSKVAQLAYNYPDSPTGGAIATKDAAGANSFDFDRIAADIKKAKTEANFVIVNVQYWECYSYPDGYVEYPQCDVPTGKQEPDFKKLVDLGADMVVGSSAHQPQYYEVYNGKPIYYGLGNLYFDQTQWPGTERGIILTHYFSGGKLLQTKLSPTRYDKALQTALMPNQEAESFLARLQAARR